MELLVEQLAAQMAEWMADRSHNALAPGSPEPAFDTPLLGCASGADPLFAFLKQDIGPEFYWRPEEAFRLAFPEDDARPEDLSVIAWVLPQTARTRAAHRKAREMPSLEWSQVRHYGEQVNERLRAFAVEALAGRGIRATAPMLLPQWSRETSPRYGYASRWSERHTAHVCSLGTFGLSDGLITPRGKAVRVGSVVARVVLEPSPRPYTRHNEWCLRFAKGVCRGCIKRCPAGAISEAGHDKKKCHDYIRQVTAVHVEREQLGFKVSSCGLCQTGVPCESRNPTAPKAASTGTRGG